MHKIYFISGLLSACLSFGAYATTPDKPVTNLGAATGKDIVMLSSKAKLDQSKLGKIQGVRYITGMLKPDSGAAWEIDVRKGGDYILEVAYAFPWTDSASAAYEFRAGNSEPFTWYPATTGGSSSDGGTRHLGQMSLEKGKQKFTFKKKGNDGIFLSYVRLIPVESFPVITSDSSGKLILSPDKALIENALAKEYGKKIIISHMNKISWTLSIPKERAYTMELEYAAGAAPTTASGAKIAINGKETKLYLPGTGGFSRYVKSEPIPVNLPAGEVKITFSGAEFRNLKLSPE